MARIQYERPDGSVGTRESADLNYDAESGHWLLLESEEEGVIYIPRERVYFVEEGSEPLEEGGDEGW